MISQNDEIQAKTFNSHACKTNNKKTKFIEPYNAIETSIIQVYMKADQYKKGLLQ